MQLKPLSCVQTSALLSAVTQVCVSEYEDLHMRLHQTTPKGFIDRGECVQSCSSSGTSIVKYPTMHCKK